MSDSDLLNSDLLNNKYQLTHLIGSGGFGDVYGATDLTLKRSVAVKLLKENVSSQPIAAERFLKEAQLTSQLTHPNTLNIYDFGQHKGRLFLVSELLNGESLRERLLNVGCYSPQHMVSLFLPICSALHEAHLAGVIHRDLKPDNLFVHQSFDEERLILIDFGIAKTMGDIHLTQTGQVFGTPHYMAPEQIKESKQVDARADVYSLGVIFYEVLSGLQPFSGDSLFEIFDQHVRGEIPRLAQRISPALAPFDELLQQMLCKQVEDRLVSAHLVAQSLRALQERGLSRETFGSVSTTGLHGVGATSQLLDLNITEPTVTQSMMADLSSEVLKTPHSTTNFVALNESLYEERPRASSDLPVHIDHREIDDKIDHSEIDHISKSLPATLLDQTLDIFNKTALHDQNHSHSLVTAQDLSAPTITSGTFSFGQGLMKLSTFFALSLALLWSGRSYYNEYPADHNIAPTSPSRFPLPQGPPSALEDAAKYDGAGSATPTPSPQSAPQLLAEPPTLRPTPVALAAEAIAHAAKEDPSAQAPMSPFISQSVSSLKSESAQGSSGEVIQSDIVTRRVQVRSEANARKRTKKSARRVADKRTGKVVEKRAEKRAKKRAKKRVKKRVKKRAKKNIKVPKVVAEGKVSSVPKMKTRRPMRSSKTSFKSSLKMGLNLFSVGQVSTLRLSSDDRDILSKEVRVTFIPKSLGRFKRKRNVRLGTNLMAIGEITWETLNHGKVKVCVRKTCKQYSIEIR